MHTLTVRHLARRVAMAGLAGTVVTSSAWSQSDPTPSPESLGIVPGARVRLVSPSYGEGLQTGTVVAVRGDSIAFRRDSVDDSLVVGFAHIGRLDVCRGRQDRMAAGLGLGFVGGAIAGAALGLATYTRPSFFGPGANAAGGAILGGAGGALLGVIIGSTVHAERWHTVSLGPWLEHPQAGITVLPTRSGPRLALRLAAQF